MLNVRINILMFQLNEWVPLLRTYVLQEKKIFQSTYGHSLQFQIKAHFQTGRSSQAHSHGEASDIAAY